MVDDIIGEQRRKGSHAHAAKPSSLAQKAPFRGPPGSTHIGRDHTFQQPSLMSVIPESQQATTESALSCKTLKTTSHCPADRWHQPHVHFQALEHIAGRSHGAGPRESLALSKDLCMEIVMALCKLGK